MAFNRGKRISGALTRRWQETGGYHDARSILDMVIMETQIISEVPYLKGYEQIMNTKIKGIIADDKTAQAFIQYEVKLIKPHVYSSYFSGPNIDEAGESVGVKIGDVVTAERVLYYIKTNKGWVNISEQEYKKQMLFRK